MKSRLIASLSTGILGLSLVATTALAHHGWGGQSTEPFTLKGKVETPLSLSGPHATMKIKDDKGQIWELTLAPPPRTQRAGLEEGLIPAGADVTILGKRNLDLKRFEVKTERVTWNGKNYDVYPDRL